MTYDPTDPFSGGEKVPSLSWKGLPIGSLFILEISAPAKALQSRNFDTNLPDYWDPDKTRPKMSAVVNVRVLQGPHSVGEDRSIWAQIPSNLFVAIKEAQKAVDRRLEPGGILHLKFIGETPHEDKRKNPIKNYAARYTPPAMAQQSDPFTDQSSHQSPAASTPGMPSWGSTSQPATTGSKPAF